MNDARLIYELQRRIERLETQIETGRWVNWTPTVTQSVSVTKTIHYARYIIRDKLAHVEVGLAMTSAGITANAIIIGGWPTAIQCANVDLADDCKGDFTYHRTTGTYYDGSAVFTGASDLRFVVSGNAAKLGFTPTFAIASGDYLSFKLAYEVG